jgi:hypothetical protein
MSSSPSHSYCVFRQRRHTVSRAVASVGGRRYWPPEDCFRRMGRNNLCRATCRSRTGLTANSPRTSSLRGGSSVRGVTLPQCAPIHGQSLFWLCPSGAGCKGDWCEPAQASARPHRVVQLSAVTPTVPKVGEEREVLYPWHPWVGCIVRVHEMVEKVAAPFCAAPGREDRRSAG